jgi:hypothetical protein
LVLAERLIIDRLPKARFSSLAKANIEIRQLLECRITRRCGGVEARSSLCPRMLERLAIARVDRRFRFRTVAR